MLLVTDVPELPNVRITWAEALDLDVEVADQLTEEIDELLDAAIAARKRKRG